MRDRDELAPVDNRVFQREPDDSLASFPRGDRRGLGDGTRIPFDGDEHLVTDVEPFCVLANQDQIHVFVATSRNDRSRRSDVRVEVELPAQRHIDRPEPLTDRSGERSLQHDPVLAHAFQRRVGQRVARLFQRRHPAELAIPLDTYAGGIEHPQRGLGDLRTDPVAGNEGHHGRHGSPGVSVLRASRRADHGSSPSACATVRQPTRPVRTSAITSVNSARPLPSSVTVKTRLAGTSA